MNKVLVVLKSYGFIDCQNERFNPLLFFLGGKPLHDDERAWAYQEASILFSLTKEPLHLSSIYGVREAILAEITGVNQWGAALFSLWFDFLPRTEIHHFSRTG